MDGSKILSENNDSIWSLYIIRYACTCSALFQSFWKKWKRFFMKCFALNYASSCFNTSFVRLWKQRFRLFMPNLQIWLGVPCKIQIIILNFEKARHETFWWSVLSSTLKLLRNLGKKSSTFSNFRLNVCVLITYWLHKL